MDDLDTKYTVNCSLYRDLRLTVLRQSGSECSCGEESTAVAWWGNEVHPLREALY